jgi:tRNA pseudouridine38-40 synthase
VIGNDEAPPDSDAGALLAADEAAADGAAADGAAADGAAPREKRRRAVTLPFGVLLTLAYDGAPFSGWARQRDLRTVAGELQGAIETIDPRATELRGVSRTDAGVHARGQLASFDTARDIDGRGWVLALSKHLPREIAVVRAARVPAGYDPRRHAIRKHYRYVIVNSSVRDPFLETRAWRLHGKLDVSAMQREAERLLGRHDFRAFRSVADVRRETVRNILRAEVRSQGGNTDTARVLTFDIEGDRFMHNMVRIIVGTLAEVGRGRLAEGVISKALETGQRRDLGMTAPPDGLYLERIDLTETGEDPWPAFPAATG